MDGKLRSQRCDKWQMPWWRLGWEIWDTGTSNFWDIFDGMLSQNCCGQWPGKKTRRSIRSFDPWHLWPLPWLHAVLSRAQAFYIVTKYWHQKSLERHVQANLWETHSSNSLIPSYSQYNQSFFYEVYRFHDSHRHVGFHIHHRPCFDEQPSDRLVGSFRAVPCLSP